MLFALSSYLSTSVAAQTATQSAAVQSNDTLPPVIEHAQPIYPPLARTARIEGDVLIRITTDGESVKDTEVESGHPLLRQAAVDNVKTWKFARHEPGIFHVTFRYKLISSDVDVEFIDPSPIVRILVEPQQAILDYIDVSLGTWKVHMRSANGEADYIFKLAYSGPTDNEWLDGEVISSNGKSEDIQSGYYQNGLFGFTVELRQNGHDGTRTYFVGKIKGNTISGTLIDDRGVRGEWNAVKIHK